MKSKSGRYNSLTKKNGKENRMTDKVETFNEKYIFPVFYILSQNQLSNFYSVFLCFSFEGFQLLIYPFQERFKDIWKGEKVFEILSENIQYFKIVPFFLDNQELYFLIFYLVIIVHLIFFFSLILVMYLYGQKNFTTQWPIRFFSLPFSQLGNVFFLPVTELIMSIFYCDSETNKVSYAQSFECDSKTHKMHMSIAGIFIFIYSAFYIFITFVVCDIRKNSLMFSAKKTSFPDLFLLLTKIYFAIINAIFSNKGYKCSVLFLSFLFSFIVLGSFYYYSPYYNDNIMALIFISVGVNCYGHGVVFFSYFLRKTRYTGALPLFIIGVVLIIFFFLHKSTKRVNVSSLILLPNQIRNEKTFIEHVNTIEKISEESEHKQRTKEIMLFSYLQKYEENCIEKNCFLKQYFDSSEKNILFLYKHIEQLYAFGINKFPTSLELRFEFVIFLKKKLRKKQKAKKELEKMKFQCQPNLMEEYCIYLLMKELETNSNVIKDEKDFFFDKAYSNLKANFRDKINSVVTNYLFFWNLLLSSNRDVSQDLNKLSLIGNKISTLNEDIKKQIQLLQKINAHDYEIEQLLLLYQSEILNKTIPKEKLFLLKNKEENEGEEEEDVFTHENFQSQMMKENKVIVLSGEEKNFGTITNISLSASSFFGYSRDEILGQNINMLIPKILHKNHELMLKDKVNEVTRELLFQDEKTTLDVLTKNNLVFGVAKSRYLVPVSFKVSAFKDEEERIFFIGRVIHCKKYVNSDVKPCYVLTNTSFIIQSFTSNSESLLDLHSSFLNGKFDIVSFIKEFNEEYLKLLVEQNENNQKLSSIDQIKNKHNIMKMKFSQPTIITWKVSGVQGSMIMPPKSPKAFFSSTPHGDENETKQSRISYKPKSSLNTNLKTFIMTFQKITILDKVCGFLFKFEKTKPNSAQQKAGKPQSFGSSKLRVINNLNNLEESEIGGASVSEVNNLSDVNEITSDFIPQSNAVNDPSNKNLNFVIDIKNMSYKVKELNKKDSRKTNEKEDYRENIKTAAMKKLNSIKKAYEEEESSKESNSSSGDSDSDSSAYDSLTGSEETGGNVSSSSVNNKKTENEESPGQATKFHYTDDFYKIHQLEKVKLMKYDFVKKMILEVPKDEAKIFSKVDDVITKEKLRTEEFILNSKKEVEELEKERSFISLRGKDSKKNLITLKSGCLKGKKEETKEKEKESDIKKDCIVKEISDELQKKDTHSSVIWIKIITLLILVFLIVELAWFLIYLHNSEKLSSKHFALVVCSSSFLVSIIHAVFHVRELTLLANENYTTIYDSNRTRYILNQTEELYSIFEQLTKIEQLISDYSDIYSGDTFYLLNNMTVVAGILKMQQYEDTVNVSYSTAISLLESSLFRISQSDAGKVIPLNTDVYFFITNALNSNCYVSLKQRDAFAEDFEAQVNLRVRISLIICVVSWAVNISSFFIFQRIYIIVLSKREAYIEVFYEIGNDIIISSLHKCEKFITAMNAKNNTDLVDEDDSASTETEVLNTNSENPPPPTNQKHHSHSSLIQKSSFNFRYGVWLFGVVGVSASITAVYVIRIFARRSNIDLLKMIREKNLVEVNTFLTYNTFRELVFNSNAKFNYTSISLVTPMLLNSYYLFISQKFESLNNMIKNTKKNIEDEYYSLFNKDICFLGGSFFEEYFDGKENCDTFSSGAISLGLDITLKYFIEEIRILYHNYQLLNQMKQHFGFSYNLTLIGTSADKALWPTTATGQRLYLIAHPISIFNQEGNKYINYLYRFILRPAFNKLETILHENAQQKADLYLFVGDLLLSLSIVLIVLAYLFGWKTYENNLEESIYKTKKMLSIIPIDSLLKVKNITRLLNIEEKTQDNKNLWK